MTDPYEQRWIGERELAPESLMMSYGYRPVLSEGALKCPIFQTSTFVFNSAEEGKAVFESGMGAIATTAFTYLRPGDTLLFSEPVYGGTQYLFREILPQFGIHTGGTESLAQHPGTMTHSDIPSDEQRSMGITSSMIRLSVGVENVEDLKADLAQALEGADTRKPSRK